EPDHYTFDVILSLLSMFDRNENTEVFFFTFDHHFTRRLTEMSVETPLNMSKILDYDLLKNLKTITHKLAQIISWNMALQAHSFDGDKEQLFDMASRSLSPCKNDVTVAYPSNSFRMFIC